MLAIGCGYDNHEGCDMQLSEATPNLLLSQLASYANKATPLPEGAVVRGRVVANDSSGNFYQMIVLEGVGNDKGVAVEVRLALYDLHALYPVGSIVTFRCGGLAVGRHWGCLSIGREGYGWNNDTLEPLAPRHEVVGRVEIAEVAEAPTAVVCQLGELDRSMCGQLVQIKSLRFAGEPTQWAVSNYGSEVDHTFEDSAGRKIMIRTSRYADFASERIPSGEFDARGILYASDKEGQEVFVLKMRDRYDILE